MLSVRNEYQRGNSFADSPSNRYFTRYIIELISFHCIAPSSYPPGNAILELFNVDRRV